MAVRHQAIIQQLFEEGPPSSLGSSIIDASANMVTSTMDAASLVKNYPRRTTLNTTTTSTSGRSKSKSTSVITNSDKSRSPSKSSTAGLRNANSARSSNRIAHSTPANTTSRGLSKMTSKAAVEIYGRQLSAFEKKEIHQYPRVYYLGLDASKITTTVGTQGAGAGGVEADHSLYDDEEHFYRIVPKDHIAYRFEIAERYGLGKGTFGQVIKAYDHKFGKFVALKIVRNQRIYLKQSREELRILQLLRKQDPHGIYNVVHIFDFFMFRSHMVICFELLGMNLYQVLKRNNYRGLPASRILPIAKAVCKCLELLFKNSIIHCDIKPENIMLRQNGVFTSIKVGDFGSSCYTQQQVYHYIQSRYYRAPEVMLGLRYGPAIDMWSFGCVLAELCTGSPIFVGSSEEDQLCAIEEVIGEVPRSLMVKARNHRGPRPKGRGHPGSKSLSSVLEGDDTFKDMMSKMLEIEPTLRPTPSQLWDHPWLNPTKKLQLHQSSKSKSTSDVAIKKRMRDVTQ